MKKDFFEYYLKLQSNYLKALEQMEKINKQVSEGLITPEQKEQFATYFNNIKTNYDRVAYSYSILMAPPKFIKNIQTKIYKKKMNKYLESIAQEEETENTEALEGMEEIVGEENTSEE